MAVLRPLVLLCLAGLAAIHGAPVLKAGTPHPAEPAAAGDKATVNAAAAAAAAAATAAGAGAAPAATAPAAPVHPDANDAPLEELFEDEDAEWDDFEDGKQRDEDFDHEYQRYMDEVIEEMADDPEVVQEVIDELEGMDHEERSDQEDELLAIAKRLENAHLRSQLEEQERVIIEQQRRMAKRQRDHDEGEDDHEADDYDYGDEDEDLWDDYEHNKEKIHAIAEQRVKLIHKLDEKRHRAFKEHHMEKELRFREELSKVEDETMRDSMLEHHRKQMEHIHNAKGHHPGGKQQLEAVWHDEDGFDTAFDSKIFFRLHDASDDGFWDIKEFEALFYHEAFELHAEDGEADEDDVYEEMEEMREAVMPHIDLNNDGLISEKEFIAWTVKDEFDDDIPWQAIYPDIDEDDLEAFRLKRARASNDHKDNVHINPAMLKAGKHAEEQLKKHHESARVVAQQLRHQIGS